MKIIILAKAVPDVQSNIQLSADSKNYDTSSFSYILNPCDEYAIEAAIQIQERFGGESTVLSLGPQHAQEAIRKAFAMGVERGIWINTEDYLNTLDSFLVASALAKIISAEKPDIIFAGLNTLDEGAANIGPMVAEFLGIPSLINISKISWLDDNKSLQVESDTTNGMIESYQTQLPVLIAPHQNLFEPRFPSLINIIKANKKTIIEKKISSLDIDLNSKVKVTGFKLPPKKSPVKIFEAQPMPEIVQELVNLLRNKEKVI